MTLDEVRSLVHAQSIQSLSTTNEHRITLANALVLPKALTVIWRTTKNGRRRDEELHVCLVGQESSADGYKIIVRDDGQQFGLASSGALRGRGRKIGTPHIRDAFPAAIALLFPYLQRLPTVGRGFAVGIVDGKFIASLGIGQIARSCHFDFRGCPVERETRRR